MSKFINMSNPEERAKFMASMGFTPEYEEKMLKESVKKKLPIPEMAYKLIEAGKFDKTTFKWIIAHKKGQKTLQEFFGDIDVEDRLKVALFDFGFSMDEVDKMSIKEMVDDILARGYKKKHF